jgi:hypothetical protein
MHTIFLRNNEIYKALGALDSEDVKLRVTFKANKIKKLSAIYARSHNFGDFIQVVISISVGTRSN